ncbi:MAG: multidrug ABC transporter substrate-binding protein [Hydrogenophilales bacterium CG_4_9_14_3_um_filter_59_35]|nr:MAG: multidrug ABC transporter substrate-binding protein [Hydrogenophilales bacterium CG18_big_fil_WC_8_21_14_2_50_58_12]PJB07826.1 MAG: multidrug ABC transporter substrate-binding protein [Hydrogenophilales bacterium CG_4_9_14_3_um_filter_59_35]
MLWNALLLAMREIRRNVLRSFLTILGIVIGVAAVIIMVTLGGGATVQVTQQIASLGSNLLMITPGKRMGPGQNVGAAPFSVDDALALARDIPQLVAVAPMASRSMTVVFGNANWSTQITGATNDFFKARNWAPGAGRLFTESELRAGAAVCVIGQTVRQKLLGNQNPIGTHLREQKISCEVIGLLEPKGQSAMGTDQDDLVVIPLRAFQRRIAGNLDINIIQVSVREGRSTARAQQDMERLMRERRHLSGNEENDFNVMDMKEITKMLTGTTQVLTALLGAVAAVSLLVGGIGIMNIMLVSVTERTREIGIRLAIGALESEVLLQFLVEAAVLSSFGGAVGIVLALAASVGLASVLNVPFVFNASIVAIAFVFSAAVGLVFGYFPAKKAAQLDPIEALRHE